MWNQWLGRFLGIIGWDPSVCKSNRLHVHILRFSFIRLGYILYISLKWSVIFLQSSTSTGYFSNSTGSFVTNCRFSPIIGQSRWLCWGLLYIVVMMPVRRGGRNFVSWFWQWLFLFVCSIWEIVSFICQSMCTVRFVWEWEVVDFWSWCCVLSCMW